eukprot:7570797-Heterocapsa_arctica.AAC.2
MLTSMSSESEQLSIASEGFGSYDDKYGTTIVGGVETPVPYEKPIPIRYLPVQIELELVSTSGDAVMSSDIYGTAWSISDAQ